VVSGTFTHLKWSLLPPDFKDLYKILMKIAQILIKSTTCMQQWSTGRLEKYWKPCLNLCVVDISILFFVGIFEQIAKLEIKM